MLENTQKYSNILKITQKYLKNTQNITILRKTLTYLKLGENQYHKNELIVICKDKVQNELK